MTVTIEPSAGGAAETMAADVVLVAIGRVPFSDGLGLVAVGVTLDARKRIAVDEHYQTNVAGIFAIGDVIAGPMLAHKAEDEGIAVAELLSGKAGHETKLVVSSTELAVYIFENGKAHGTKGVKIRAMVQQSGKTATVEFAPVDDTKLVAKLAESLSKGAIVVLTGKDDDGDVISARYVIN